ncbi:MAG: hypothetical protein JST28_00605 [Acidobacteria bacterium]|nr:hypothetical protein [Acidobacteriota bacterium]
MHAIGKFLIDAIVVMFFVGMAGSAVVIVISFVEDFRELFGSDESTPEHEGPPPSTHERSAAYSYSPGREPLHPSMPMSQSTRW